MSDKPANWRNLPVERHCRHCGTKFIGKYNSSSCDDCKQEFKNRASRNFEAQNPDYWKDWWKSPAGKLQAKKQRLKQYGLTTDEYDALYEAQDGKCAICGASSGWKANGGQLVIDHCHESGEVRGLLCPPCNRGLGQFDDDLESLFNAMKYIWRAGDKGNTVQDLEKAVWYLKCEIQRLKDEQDDNQRAEQEQEWRKVGEVEFHVVDGQWRSVPGGDAPNDPSPT